ncbi:xanthosine triphosphate pyrophosphatase [Pelotomaculum thermopropionicum SI]|uniref:dITP/XTP pyrophosphatase n=1 Tax=Pelotomaculum thermopropionicum (strain DSM 13744 / JCM 10971 / SI) TaxID=370438 RepID=A5D467_PELTS|nr:xanthosine triphosphate pyrophosphatase [Pelotomaculum thermopropionicum SI]
MLKLVLATRNKNKIKEMIELLAPSGIEALSLDQFPRIGRIEEDGRTFRENAVKKASAVCEQTGMMALADDSGLEVDCLDGAPGVFSSRFAGEGSDDRANNEKLLELLTGVPPEQRRARFRCVIAIAAPDGFVYTAEGTCEGYIAEELRGEGGFGYDPLFYLPEFGKTLAELDLKTKNKVSHRGKALLGALDILAELKAMEEQE